MLPRAVPLGDPLWEGLKRLCAVREKPLRASYGSLFRSGHLHTSRAQLWPQLWAGCHMQKIFGDKNNRTSGLP